MGKASRHKSSAALDDRTREGITLAAEMVRHPNVLPTFASIARLSELSKTSDISMLSQLADVIGEDDLAQSLRETPLDAARTAKQLREITPQAWAEGMQPALRERKFMDFIEQMIRVAHQKFWSSDPYLALQFNEHFPVPPDDPIVLALSWAHRKLTADPQHAGWIALALFCLGRAIAVNSNKGFEGDEWSEVTLMWFSLEKSFLAGDGQDTAKGVLEIKKAFPARLTEIIGSRMMHGLAEGAINAGSSRLFQ